MAVWTKVMVNGVREMVKLKNHFRGRIDRTHQSMGKESEKL